METDGTRVIGGAVQPATYADRFTNRFSGSGLRERTFETVPLSVLQVCDYRSLYFPFQVMFANSTKVLLRVLATGGKIQINQPKLLSTGVGQADKPNDASN